MGPEEHLRVWGCSPGMVPIIEAKAMEIIRNPLSSHTTFTLFGQFYWLCLLNKSGIQSHLTTSTAHHGPSHHLLPGLSNYDRPLCFIRLCSTLLPKGIIIPPLSHTTHPTSLRGRGQVLTTLYQAPPTSLLWPLCFPALLPLTRHANHIGPVTFLKQALGLFSSCILCLGSCSPDTRLLYFAIYNATHLLSAQNTGLLCPCIVLTIPVYNAHPYFSLKNFGKKVQSKISPSPSFISLFTPLIHGIYPVYWGAPDTCAHTHPCCYLPLFPHSTFSKAEKVDGDLDYMLVYNYSLQSLYVNDYNHHLTYWVVHLRLHLLLLSVSTH